MADPIANAIINYHDLNVAVVDEMQGEPSPLEFMRFVAKNRPFVARGAVAEWTALRAWDASYLRDAMRDQQVKVAITPRGNADAVVERENGSLVFVEPYEMFEVFGDFLGHIQADSEATEQKAAVRYAQTRSSASCPDCDRLIDEKAENDNLREEYSALFKDVPDSIPFARIALEEEPDAINLWIGNGRSVTSLHKDNYENIYVQIRGRKHFVLLPPVEMPCVNETPLPKARYQPDSKQVSDSEDSFVIEDDNENELVPVALWDPDVPEDRATQYSPLSKPLRVTLNEGDMLYLPAMWYHKVSQTAGEEGFACAVNYWYDMDFDGSFWTANELMRDVVNARASAVAYPELELGDG